MVAVFAGGAPLRYPLSLFDGGIWIEREKLTTLGGRISGVRVGVAQLSGVGIIPALLHSFIDFVYGYIFSV